MIISLGPYLESGVAVVKWSVCFLPENCAQEATNELVHCHGAQPNPGLATAEASCSVHILSSASELLCRTCLLSVHMEHIRSELYFASQRKQLASPCGFDSSELSLVGAMLVQATVVTDLLF